MFSLKSLFGKDEKFYDLLEASAEEALVSTRLLATYLKRSESFTSAGDLDDFIQSRRKDKRITQQITEELCKTFVTPIEREDIEELSRALYRIPKIAEKLVERLSIYPGRFPREGFQRQTELLGQAAEAVVFMVKQLRKGAKLEGVQEANERLQYAEGQADKVMLGQLKELYHGPYDAKETVILQELFEMAEKAIDRCRDAGNVVFQIVLKYS
ncbi:phosphate transport regulator related to PhoU [Opitutaceae bacterium TAV1]|nr:phosphate transport regulator [Opitutaceae bacterium TAV5]EIP99727.1 phosphate transport regulator related to PhoU [Opitutaceae bacterium TAV1]